MVTKIVKKLGIGLAAVAALVLIYVLLNIPYFLKQLRFSSHKNTAPTEQGEEGRKAQPNLLEIRSLNIIAPIIEVQDNNEKSFQEALKNGVVHYPGSAKVGEVGNAYLFGHSSDFAFKSGGYKTVFALLPKIKKDEEVMVSDSEGNQFIYIVTETKVVGPNDTSVLDQDTNGEKHLTLQTSYPVGTALRRFIVISKLRQ